MCHACSIMRGINMNDGARIPVSYTGKLGLSLPHRDLVSHWRCGPLFNTRAAADAARRGPPDALLPGALHPDCERPGLRATGARRHGALPQGGSRAPRGPPSPDTSGPRAGPRTVARSAHVLRVSTAAAGDLGREHPRPRVAAGVLVVAVHAQNDRVSMHPRQPPHRPPPLHVSDEPRAVVAYAVATHA